MVTPTELGTEFLRNIYWEERWLELEAEGEVELPGFAGSTIRGALGAVMRPELCVAPGGCGEFCREPQRCGFFSLFEQSRANNGAGANQPKPLVLDPPCGEELQRIARGGAVRAPFVLKPGTPLAEIENHGTNQIQSGQRVRVGIRGFGAASAALDGVVEGVRRSGLECKGGRLRLRAVEGGPRRLEWNDQATRLRVNLLTPLMTKDGDGVCREPLQISVKLLEQAVVRTVQVYNTFFSQQKLPFVNAIWPGLQLTGYRLFRHDIERRSYRQGKWMRFSGIVGSLEWEGNVAPLVPWLRAAEVLHIGQKATFGLGKVECLLE
jgi:hypothetical protein